MAKSRIADVARTMALARRRARVNPQREVVLREQSSIAGYARARVLIAVATCVLGGLYTWRGAVTAVPPRETFALLPLDPRQQVGATAWLGLDRWAFVDQGWRWLFLALAVAAGVGVARSPDLCRRLACALGEALQRPGVRLGVAVASVALFWHASTRQGSFDSAMFPQRFADAAARTEAFVTHDEMLEFYIHSRLWLALHTMWGWNVPATYRIISCFAGGFAVFLGLGLVRRFALPRWPLVVAGLFSGGWVLLFFGDVENYTLTNTVVLAYFVVALRYLDDEHAWLWPVGLVLGIATLFHLLALVLAPSLLVLAWIAFRRGRRLDATAAMLAVPVLLGAALYWFDRHGLPITDLASQSQVSAKGGRWSLFLPPADARYFWLQAQLVLLLAPCVVLLPARFVADTPRRGAQTTFLAVAAAGSLLMVALWRTQIGIYEDWNLYAIVAQPLGLLVFGGLAWQRRIGGQAGWLAAVVVLMTSQSAAWIAQHHAVVAP